MTLLQVFFIVSWFTILLVWYDIYKKQRFNFLHIFIFIWIAFFLILFTFFPNFLNWFGRFVWVQRWADALVYMSIIFLLYFVLFLFNKIEKNKTDTTRLIREIAFLEYELRKHKNEDK